MALPGRALPLVVSGVQMPLTVLVRRQCAKAYPDSNLAVQIQVIAKIALTARREITPPLVAARLGHKKRRRLGSYEETSRDDGQFASEGLGAFADHEDAGDQAN